jgi:hypothetical protein
MINHEICHEDIIADMLNNEKKNASDLIEIENKFLAKKRLSNFKKIKADKDLSPKDLLNFVEKNDSDKQSILQSTKYDEFPKVKEKYLEALKNNHNRTFQVKYTFRSNVKRMYRLDCILRKINVYIFLI